MPGRIPRLFFKTLATGGFAACLGGGFGGVLGSGNSPAAPPKATGALRVATVNLLFSNSEMAAATTELLQLDADVLLLLEWTDEPTAREAILKRLAGCQPANEHDLAGGFLQSILPWSFHFSCSSCHV